MNVENILYNDCISTIAGNRSVTGLPSLPENTVEVKEENTTQLEEKNVTQVTEVTQLVQVVQSNQEIKENATNTETVEVKNIEPFPSETSILNIKIEIVGDPTIQTIPSNQIETVSSTPTLDPRSPRTTNEPQNSPRKIDELQNHIEKKNDLVIHNLSFPILQRESYRTFTGAVQVRSVVQAGQ